MLRPAIFERLDAQISCYFLTNCEGQGVLDPRSGTCFFGNNTPRARLPLGTQDPILVGRCASDVPGAIIF